NIGDAGRLAVDGDFIRRSAGRQVDASAGGCGRAAAAQLRAGRAIGANNLAILDFGSRDRLAIRAVDGSGGGINPVALGQVNFAVRSEGSAGDGLGIGPVHGGGAGINGVTAAQLDAAAIVLGAADWF